MMINLRALVLFALWTVGVYGGGPNCPGRSFFMQAYAVRPNLLFTRSYMLTIFKNDGMEYHQRTTCYFEGAIGRCTWANDQVSLTSNKEPWTIRHKQAFTPFGLGPEDIIISGHGCDNQHLDCDDGQLVVPLPDPDGEKITLFYLSDTKCFQGGLGSAESSPQKNDTSIVTYTDAQLKQVQAELQQCQDSQGEYCPFSWIDYDDGTQGSGGYNFTSGTLSYSGSKRRSVWQG